MKQNTQLVGTIDHYKIDAVRLNFSLKSCGGSAVRFMSYLNTLSFTFRVHIFKNFVLTLEERMIVKDSVLNEARRMSVTTSNGFTLDNINYFNNLIKEIESTDESKNINNI